MNRVALLFSVLLAIPTVSLSAQASTVLVEARKVSPNSCSYYWVTEGDFVITYVNPDLPWGTSVEVHYGLNDQFRRNSSWSQNISTSPTNAVADYTWQARFTTNVDQRGYFHSDEIHFVFKITYPNGVVAYDRGTESRLGYYTAYFDHLRLNCERDQTARLIHLGLRAIRKN